jgi:hypothetical protein
MTAFILTFSGLVWRDLLHQGEAPKTAGGKLLILSGGQGRNRTALCKYSQHSTYGYRSESSGVGRGPTSMRLTIDIPTVGENSPMPDQPGSERQAAVKEAAKHAKASAEDILAKWTSLSIPDRRKIVTAFRAAMIPRRRAGRKPSEALSAAYTNWR